MRVGLEARVLRRTAMSSFLLASNALLMEIPCFRMVVGVAGSGERVASSSALQ